MKIKKGDNVVVIAGKSKGSSGTVARVLPKKEMVVIDGLNLSKKHRKPNQRTRKGQIIDKVMPIHISNVMLADPKDGKPTRVRIERTKDGTRERVAVKSKTKIA